MPKKIIDIPVEKLPVAQICSTKCYGVDNHDGACCKIADRDFIIGPHSEEDIIGFLTRLSTKFDREIKREDVFIDYEEGKNLFPNKLNWQSPKNYPAFRIDTNNPNYPCIFYNETVKACMIHNIRPLVCFNYYCDYVRKNGDIK